MKDLGVQIFQRDFGAIFYRPRLRYQVERLTWRAVGGPDQATVRVLGSTSDIWEIFEMLRCPVEVFDAEGSILWWGYVEGAQVSVGGVQIGILLERMANRVRVVYVVVNTAGVAGERADTVWVQDDDSVAEYGTKERKFSLAQGTAAEALARANTLLQQLKYPLPLREFGNYGEIQATLTCRGWWQTLDWTYYENPLGKEGYEEAGNGLQAFGKGLTSTTISFEAGSTHKIKDSTKGLVDFSAGERVYVEGSASNDGVYTISSVRDVDGGGSYLIVEEVVVGEGAGASVTLHMGDKVGQSFQLATAVGWEAGSIRLRLKREGNPGDQVVCRLRADSGSNTPGADLATATLNGADISENLNWVEFMLSARVSLAPATTYWITIERTGGLETANYYKIDANEELGYPRGEMKIHHGSIAWDSRAPDADVLFAVGGVQETTQQLLTILSGAQFFTAVDLEIESGVWSSPWRSGDRTALNEAEDLLDSGTSNQRRMLASVDRNRRVRVYEEPASGGGDYFLRQDGQMSNYLDVLLDKTQYPVGVWARLKDIIPASVDVTRLADPNKVFIEEVNYDNKNERVSMREREAGRLLEV
jgi:hypothetical protein